MNAEAKKNFRKEIEERLSDVLGSNYDVSVLEVLKTNVSLDAVNIREKGTNISPTIYLNKYYSMMDSGDIVTIDEVVSEIISIYENHRAEIVFDPNDFLDFDKVKGKIVSKIINSAKNEKLLEDTPHIKILDGYLAIVFTVLVDISSDGTGSILIKNTHKAHWGVTDAELMMVATENNKIINPVVVQSIDQVLKEMLVNDISSAIANEVDMEELQEMFQQVEDLSEQQFMYVLTNYSKYNGSIYLADIEVLSSFCEQHNLKRVAIIPSSTSEVLLVSAANDSDFVNYNCMLNEVNTEVAECDYLGDKCMLFDNESKTLSVIE